jgi:hypothetical protein
MSKKTIALLALGLALVAGTASAKVLELGNLVVNAEGGFAPTSLPKHEDAPIKLFGRGKASTKSGELPPIVETIEIEFDRHGHVETKGLEVCQPRKLQSTTVEAARKACPNAIVGKGRGTAMVEFAESKPFPVSSPITIFNGPKQHGDDTVIAHAYTTVPVPTTFIVPIVIEKVHHGVYGYRTKARIPKIAGGAGHPISGNITVNRRWTFKGQHLSFVNARCETGHLQAKVKVSFKGGQFLAGTFVKPCTVRN